MDVWIWSSKLVVDSLSIETHFSWSHGKLTESGAVRKPDWIYVDVMGAWSIDLVRIDSSGYELVRCRVRW